MNPEFETLLVETGRPGEVVPPYDTAKARPWEHFGRLPDYPYSRSSPDESVEALEAKVAMLHDDSAEAIVFGSGQACTFALLSTIVEGNHLLCGEQIYGTTRDVIEAGIRGVSHTFVDPTFENLEAELRNNTQYLFLETPTNPLLSVVDLKEVQRFSEQHGVNWIFDNTFATMFLIDGFEYGAHAVYYSASKYLGGHHYVIGGVVVTKDYDLAGELRLLRKQIGSIMPPDVAYRLNVEMQTLALRMRRECDNAAVVADYLNNHPQVTRVYYPGLKNHPGNKTATEQMKAADGGQNKYGGIVSFEVEGDYREFGDFFAKNRRTVYLMESLGSNVTILAHPTTMSHKCLTEEQRQELGINPNLFRLSVGIADFRDIIDTLDKGLNDSII